MPGQFADPGHGEAERADAGEVAGEQRFDPSGVAGLLGGAPLAGEAADAVSHGWFPFSRVLTGRVSVITAAFDEDQAGLDERPPGPAAGGLAPGRAAPRMGPARHVPPRRPAQLAFLLGGA